MSGDGGDSGGGGGSESGGSGKGGGNSSSGSGYTAGDYSPSAPTSFSPSSDSSGGLNLAGSGPVGGDSGLPGAGGGTNTFGGGSFDSFVGPTAAGGVSSVGGSGDLSNPNAFVGPTPDLGTSAASAPASAGASAFAAPAGISGSPQLDSFIASPNGSTAPSAGTDASSPGVLDSLLPAEKGAVDSYVAKQPLLNTSDSGSSTLPSSGGGSSGGSSGGSGSGNSGSGSNGFNLNSLGAVVAGGGLLNNLINGNKGVPESANLNNAAGSANAVAAQQNAAGVALQQYVTTGTLPQGYEDQVQQAAQAAKQQIISNYANRGLPTDPTKNSPLAQELAQVDAKLPAMREQIAGTLATQGGSMVNAGLQATGISAGVFNNLANLETAQNTARATAIANFAASLNGGTKPGSINLKVA
jgi:hypothetical protein